MLAGLLGTFRSGAAPLLAHQGGWDEILLIVGPMAVIAGLLVVAKRRVDAAARPPSADERTLGSDPEAHDAPSGQTPT